MNRFCHSTGVGIIPVRPVFLWCIVQTCLPSVVAPFQRGYLYRPLEKYGMTTRVTDEKAWRKIG